ncbi:MAG: cyclic nucleotide-binding domain-containing protein [Myxococcales bacterium]|nr:cyclic nucleotide-binding domain-containing protein [Myxococcales bacterium]
MHQLEITERVIRLRSVPVFRTMPGADLAQLAATVRSKTWSAGEVLLSEDAPPSSFVLIGAGRVRLTRKGKLIGTVRAPGGVGFLSFLAQGAGGTQCVAETFVDGYEIPGDAIDEIFEDHFGVLFGTLKWVASRLLPEMRAATPPPFEPPKLAMEHLIGDRSLGVVERIFLVRRMRAFSRANVNTLAALVKRMDEVRVDAGTVLWTPGERADGAMFIVKGRATSTWNDGASVQKVGGGYVVGGLEAMLNLPRWTTLRADEPCIMLRGSPEVIIDMLEDDHELARTFLAGLSTSLVEAWDKKADDGVVAVGSAAADDEDDDDARAAAQ